MSVNKFPQQFHALFSIFMVAFYLGIGIFLLFFAEKFFRIDRAMRGIMGSVFIFYGVYRISVAYKLIVEAFFKKDEDDE